MCAGRHGILTVVTFYDYTTVLVDAHTLFVLDQQPDGG